MNRKFIVISARTRLTTRSPVNVVAIDLRFRERAFMNAILATSLHCPEQK
jgi:hypothetical protein